jgi:peptidoglycan hydrolase-like protein with peptidoglycan-binding domain
VPDFSYGSPVKGLTLGEPKTLYAMERPEMVPAVVERIQKALLARGISPGRIDGESGPNTTAAVAAFQATKGLVVDGQVGKQTARALKISLQPH